MLTLGQLKPRQRFRKWNGQTGTVLYVSPGWVRVRLDRTAPRKIAFRTRWGKVVSFNRKDDRLEVDLAPGTEVIELITRKQKCRQVGQHINCAKH